MPLDRYSSARYARNNAGTDRSIARSALSWCCRAAVRQSNWPSGQHELESGLHQEPTPTFDQDLSGTDMPRSALCLALGIGLLSCASPAAPVAPAALANATPLAPPGWYASAYAAMEQCSGLTGDFSRIRWYHVAGSRVRAPDSGGYAAAVTYPSLHTIVIADFYANDTIVVRHEVMHDLADVTSHPQEWFDGRCGDLMP